MIHRRLTEDFGVSSSYFPINHCSGLIFFADGLTSVYRTEGLKGLYRGTSLALVGVSNGAIQFMGYEQLKWLCFEQKSDDIERPEDLGRMKRIDL